jgi:hypothetical protein
MSEGPMIFPFPEIEPEFEIVPRPDAEMVVLRRDTAGFFVLLEDGAWCDWTFYDYPDRRLTGITRTKIECRLKINGRECFEVSDWEMDPKTRKPAALPNHWYYALDEEWLSWVRFVWRKANGVGCVEDIDATPTPRRLFVGLKQENGHEIYLCGEDRRGEGERHALEVTGVAEVHTAGRAFRCLREVWTSCRESDGTPLTLAELFVSEEGRSVFFRRYNGRGYHNYEQLQGHPELEHRSEVYRLWYDCWPDHALGASLGGQRWGMRDEG